MSQPDREALIRALAKKNASHWYKMATVPGKPGMLMLRDGEMIAETPGERAALNGPTAVKPGDDTCPNPNQWSGNIPPSCDNNGAFRRQYTPPGNLWAYGQITLPANNPYMPQGPNPLDGDTGYVYIEGWPGAGTSDSEGGFIYSAVNNYYSLYEAAPGQGAWYSSVTLAAGSTVLLQLAAELYGCGGGGCVDVEANNPTYNDFHELPSSAWIYNCCIFATMTTIAQSPVNVFNDGAEFGPINWFDEVRCAYNQPGPGCDYPTFLAGSQRWPNDPSKVLTLGFGGGGVSGEATKINLHP